MTTAVRSAVEEASHQMGNALTLQALVAALDRFDVEHVACQPDCSVDDAARPAAVW